MVTIIFLMISFNQRKNKLNLLANQLHVNTMHILTKSHPQVYNNTVKYSTVLKTFLYYMYLNTLQEAVRRVFFIIALFGTISSRGHRTMLLGKCTHLIESKYLSNQDAINFIATSITDFVTFAHIFIFWFIYQLGEIWIIIFFTFIFTWHYNHQILFE